MNSMTSYSKPTSEQIEAAMPLLSSPQHEAYFFSRLENPLWIPPLAKRNVFKYPPPAESVEGGGVRFPPWPPSGYLARMAPLAPDEVAQLFAEMDTDNASIVGDILRAALAMPPAFAASLVQAISRAVDRETVWTHYKEASDLCLRLIEGQQADAASELATALFSARFGEDADGLNGHDAYWYNEGLQRVAPALARAKGAAFLRVMCDWLSAAVKAKKHVDTDTGADYSDLWRPAIEEHEQNHDHDLAGMLVGITRAAFEEAVRADSVSLPDALAILQKQVFQVFARLRIHLINEFAEQQPALACETMLDRAMFDDGSVKHEYAMLVGRRWGMLNPEARATWLGWVDAGPDMAHFDELVKQNVGRDATEEDRQGRIRWWQYKRLHWIHDHLSDDRLAFYNKMRNEHGEPELADLNLHVSSGWVGEESPLSIADLSALTFADAVAAVAAWQPDRSRFMGPSIDGLAATFKQYVTTDRVTFSAHASSMVGRPAAYVRGFVSAMTEAVQAGEAIDVPAVLGLCQWVVEQPVGKRTTPEQDDELLVDKDWQWTRDGISGLVKEVCQAQADTGPRYPLEEIRERIWGLVNALCRDRAKSYVIHDFSEDDPRACDYRHLGINSPRGKAVEAALEYARWVGNHLKVRKNGKDIVPGGFDAMPEVREMVEWQLASDNRTYEALSIIGSRIGVIYWIDGGWLEAYADALFDLKGIEESPPRAEGWAAWNAFLVWVRPHIDFYRQFKRQFAYAVEQAASVRLADGSREQPMHHLGEHLVLLYGRGQLGCDDDGGLLRKFIGTANPDIRRHTIGFVGQKLRREGQPPDGFVERFMALWEAYWEGPGQKDACDRPDARLFGAWFSCGKFPDRWSIDRLREFVAVAPAAEPSHSVVERLADIADTDSLTATRILDAMVRSDREGWHVSGWTESAEVILHSAMVAGGDAQREARSLINVLGRRGYTEFGRLLSD